MNRNEAGFSLAELMVAVVMTVIVTASIYGLLTGGQRAFRREPERTELQQNLRTAMDFVMRDIGNAGGGAGCDASRQICDGMTSSAQVFTVALDGQGPAVPGGGNSDVVQMLYSNASCEPLPVTGGTTSLPGTLTLPECFAASRWAIVLINTNTAPTYWGLAKDLGIGNTSVSLASSQPTGANAPAGVVDAVSISVGKLVRYEICAVVNDTLPSLCRSETGGYDASGTFQAAPDPTGGWQVVARGIENLQVEYRGGAAGAAWADVPQDVLPTDPTTITKEVRVTLSGRGSLTGIQGQSGPAGVVQTLRAQLVSTGTPRAALYWLQIQPPAGAALWSMVIRRPEAWS